MKANCRSLNDNPNERPAVEIHLRGWFFADDLCSLINAPANSQPDLFSTAAARSYISAHTQARTS
jgi:hypothetical protein